jgi:hypothetical protein
MLGKMVRKSISLSAAIAVLCVSSMVALAGTKDITGEITVTGQVTVNGQPAVSGATIVSGSSIMTSGNSSAIVSLGKLGRVEVSADSNVTLNFTDNSMTGSVDAGQIRVMNNAGIGATFTTKNSTVVADAGQANTFAINVGCGDEAKCAQTIVSTTSGLVSVKDGGNNKQVAAGTDVSVGNPSQQGCKPCLRPNPNPGVFPVGGGGGTAAALIAAVAGGAAALIYFATRGGDSVDNIGGENVVVVSPIR